MLAKHFSSLGQHHKLHESAADKSHTDFVSHCGIEWFVCQTQKLVPIVCVVKIIGFNDRGHAYSYGCALPSNFFKV